MVILNEVTHIILAGETVVCIDPARSVPNLKQGHKYILASDYNPYNSRYVYIQYGFNDKTRSECFFANRFAYDSFDSFKSSLTETKDYKTNVNWGMF